jgi:glycosyltransferase involved in cell wall biosynthesis
VTDDAPYLLDVTRLIWRRWKGRYPTGIDRVCLAYLQHFRDRAQAVVHHERFRRILGVEASRELFDLLEGPTERFRRKLPSGVLRHLRRLHDDGLNRPYLNIGHTGLDSTGFRDWATRADVRPIYLVHDLIPITHPEYCRPGEAERHRERMRTVLTTAAGMIGNSHATLEQLARFARDEGLRVPPAVTAWLGSEPLPAPEIISEPDRPTFVVVGTIEGRKNHLMLLDIWSRLVNRLGSEAPRLVIVGQRGWEADAVFDVLDQCEKLRGHVSELNRCSDEELAQQLAPARALLFPSLAEGFGLPLTEALAMGVPAIVSDLPVFREIGGAIPTYLPATDHHPWEEAILDYSRPDSAERQSQLHRLRSFKMSTWANHFHTVEEWLRSLS